MQLPSPVCHVGELKAEGEVELTSLVFPAVSGITAAVVHFMTIADCCDVTTIKRLLV